MEKIEISEAFVQELLRGEVKGLDLIRISPLQYAVVLDKPFLNLGMHYSYRTHLLLTKTEGEAVYKGSFSIPPFIVMAIVIGIGALLYDVFLLQGSGVNGITLLLGCVVLFTSLIHFSASSKIRKYILL